MGKPGVAFLLAHGWHSVSDIVVRSHTVYANLFTSSGLIRKSSLYSALDPTEKSGVSYFMGMLAAKIVGIRLLNTPWLFHLSMVDALGGSFVLKSQSEPDLVGLRRNRDWVVAEAKGRTGHYSAPAMKAGKRQTRQLRRINGRYPALRVAIQASFEPEFRWAIDDPEEFDENARDLQFNPDDLFDMYYSAAIPATEQAESRKIGERRYFVREIPEVGVSLGLDQTVRERLEVRSMGRGYTDLEAQGPVEPLVEGEFTVFPDGLAISLDDRWSSSRMEMDSWLRARG